MCFCFVFAICSDDHQVLEILSIVCLQNDFAMEYDVYLKTFYPCVSLLLLSK